MKSISAPHQCPDNPTYSLESDICYAVNIAVIPNIAKPRPTVESDIRMESG